MAFYDRIAFACVVTLLVIIVTAIGVGVYENLTVKDPTVKEQRLKEKEELEIQILKEKLKKMRQNP